MGMSRSRFWTTARAYRHRPWSASSTPSSPPRRRERGSVSRSAILWCVLTAARSTTGPICLAAPASRSGCRPRPDDAPAPIRVPALFSRCRTRGDVAHPLVGGELRVRCAPRHGLAANTLARPRDVVRLHRGGDRGIPPHCGTELDGRARLRRLAARNRLGPVAPRAYCNRHLAALAPAGGG